ncbi:MAG: methionine--tRNA ligase [Nanoarchaeota archaeon]|nr:methionine--tRNA ligase [Nanoarchaeota archaeon]|tara:strand:- start:134 stop:2128 length:1995 start_codon:yes stop_codon:yes gene_type:complete
MGKFYITTPIYYVNSDPHVGSAYTTIAADVLARWNRLKKNDVFFLTGTDEHGQKVQEAAEKEGINPKEFVDKIAKKFKISFNLINSSHDNFIRTTNKEHEEEVKKILQELFDKKFIYKGNYEAYYCVGCEQYLTESDLVDGKCHIHRTKPELRKEEAYLFKLSKFQDKLTKLIESGEFNILPLERRNEVLSFLKTGLRDISISRLKEKVHWGIELPFDKNHTCFVWVDALWNYITGLKEKKQFDKFWPPDIQLMAKDILRVHATIWSALLLATENKLPKTLFIHGYFTIDGHKMSKSLGNSISPNYMVEQYGSDALRYFLMRNIPFGQDGDFSESLLVERLNNELANDLGNLVSRVLTLTEKNFENGLKKSEIDKKLSSKLDIKKIDSHIENLELHNALNEIWRFINECNKYVNEEKIWESKGEQLNSQLYTLLESIRIISILVSPFLPQTSGRIFNQLQQNCESLEEANFGLIEEYKVKKSDVLFKKIEQEKDTKPTQKKTSKFEDIDLRVGEIKAIKDHPNADKLYIILVDLGKYNADKTIQIVSGLKLHYKKEDLLGQKIIIVANLENSVIRGVESSGMLLAIEDNKNNLSLLTASKSILGSKAYIDKPDEKAVNEIKFNEFKSIRLITKNNKIYYNQKPLKTDKEDIFLDKEMPDNLIVE